MPPVAHHASVIHFLTHVIVRLPVVPPRVELRDARPPLPDARASIRVQGRDALQVEPSSPAGLSDGQGHPFHTVVCRLEMENGQPAKAGRRVRVEEGDDGVERLVREEGALDGRWEEVKE